MANYRMIRINEETVRVLSAVIREVKDPRVSGAFVSITGADVSRDLKYAKIYWSALSDTGNEKETAAGLRSCAGFLRKRLAEELNLRVTPELSFCRDRSAQNGAHISSILREIGVTSGESEDNEEKE